MAGDIDLKALHAMQVGYCVQLTDAAVPLGGAGAMHAALTPARELTEARAEIKRLRDALDSVRQYGSDTLSGRTDGPDDRDWQRAAVLEMTRRARLALEA